MNAIRSIYMPRIETAFDARFIADVFNRNGIAQVSKVYVEPIKSVNFNRVYIEVKQWHETEAAYNFIERLRNPKKEARIIYKDDFWWAVDINNNMSKLSPAKRVLTVFQENEKITQNEFVICDDDIVTTAAVMSEDDIADDDDETQFITIDAEKTKLLRSIVADFKEEYEQEKEIETYLREAYNNRDLWYSEHYI